MVVKNKSDDLAGKEAPAKDSTPNNGAQSKPFVRRMKPFILTFLLVILPLALIQALLLHMYVCRLPSGTKVIDRAMVRTHSRLGEYLDNLAWIPPRIKPYLDYRHYIIPDGTVEIGTDAFWRVNVRSISIPGSVKRIGTRAFSGCGKLKSVFIPDGVEEIGNGAFMDCSALTNIVFPGSVKIIRGNMFMRCAKLREVIIQDGVEEMEGGVFADCTSLTRIRIPDSMIVIGGGTFSCCTALRGVEIPDNVEMIWSGAFQGCTALEEIRLPAGMASRPRIKADQERERKWQMYASDQFFLPLDDDDVVDEDDVVEVDDVVADPDAAVKAEPRHVRPPAPDSLISRELFNGCTNLK